MTISISALPELAKNEIHPVIVDNYDEVALMFPQITTAVTEAEISAYPYGHKSATLVGVGLPVHRRDGEEFAGTSFGDGYPYQMAIKQYGNKVEIPLRALEKMEARGVTAMIIQQTKLWGRSIAEKKDKLVAELFNSGGLTAGSTAVFDQSFEDGSQADPQPAVIYDGESFFGTSHPQKADTSTTYSNTMGASFSLNAANFNSALIRARHTIAYDDRGRKIDNEPQFLMTSPTLAATARQVLISNGYPGTANNDINPNQGVVSPFVWRELSDNSGNGWYVGRRDGVLVYDEGLPRFKSYIDQDRDVLCIAVESRFGRCVRDWRRWVAANHSTS